MFKKLSITQISIISGVLFLVLIVGLLTKTLTANYQSYLHFSDGIARVSLIRTLEQVAHHHGLKEI